MAQQLPPYSTCPAAALYRCPLRLLLVRKSYRQNKNQTESITTFSLFMQVAGLISANTAPRVLVALLIWFSSSSRCFARLNNKKPPLCLGAFLNRKAFFVPKHSALTAAFVVQDKTSGVGRSPSQRRELLSSAIPAWRRNTKLSETFYIEKIPFNL